MDYFQENPKPGYKWPIVGSQFIEAPAEKVWKVISMPGNLELCHPFCSENPIQVWPGETSRDRIHYLSGWIYERQFTDWIDGVGYDLLVGRSGGGKSFVSWRINAVDEDNSHLKISVYPHVLQDVPVLLRWLPHLIYLKPRLKNYLSSVTRGFKWYIERGKRVPRNHFGEHPWFS
jgi:hypothetical protein